MAANPMTQFNVYRIGPEIKVGAFDISFTNASLFMIISSVAILLIFNLGSKKSSLLPNKIQLLAELSYTFVSKMISDTAGSKAKPYFAFIFSLFMFVLFCNMFGMIPYTFTVTSHIIVTFVLAAFIFIGVTVIGFMKHGFGYLKLFVPSGVPAVLLPLIVVIEIISYLSRPVSLSVRLFANMMAGHTMMKVFAGLIIMMGSAGGLLKVGALLPLMAVIGLTGLEFLVAALQAYVFSILTCMYLHDALHLH
jgi:F-type H+-transporting ATPase subunit a